MSIEDDVDVYILGNGFDLATGLPSRYSDFFNDRFALGKAAGKPALEAIAKMPDYNAWDLIFTQFTTSDNWYNIEKIITDVMSNEGRFLMGFVTYCIIGEQKETPVEFKKIYSILCDYIEENYTNEVKKIRDLSSINDALQRIDRGKEILSPVLMEELKKEEAAFICYLQSALSTVPYKARANELFDTMETKYPDDREEGGAVGTIGGPMIRGVMSSQVILSFNYTEFIDRDPYITFANLNGSLSDKNAFFGTPDGNGVFAFTKTNRINMASTHPHNRDIAMKKIRKAPQVNCIYIFGHSMQEPDDALFRLAFRQAKIENQQTPIRFFYTLDPKNGFDKQSLISNAQNLIDRYAKDKGSLFYELTQQQLITFDKLEVSW